MENRKTADGKSSKIIQKIKIMLNKMAKSSKTEKIDEKKILRVLKKTWSFFGGSSIA